MLLWTKLARCKTRSRLNTPTSPDNKSSSPKRKITLADVPRIYGSQARRRPTIPESSNGRTMLKRAAPPEQGGVARAKRDKNMICDVHAPMLCKPRKRNVGVVIPHQMPMGTRRRNQGTDPIAEPLQIDDSDHGGQEGSFARTEADRSARPPSGGRAYLSLELVLLRCRG